MNYAEKRTEHVFSLNVKFEQHLNLVTMQCRFVLN